MEITEGNVLMLHPIDDNTLYTRHELLEILTKGIAPAIAAAPWEAAKLAEGVLTALNILAPLPKEAA